MCVWGGQRVWPLFSPSQSRKQGCYNLFSWLSMKVRGKGTRACVCLDLPTPPNHRHHHHPRPQLFIFLCHLVTPIVFCLSPALAAVLPHPGPLSGRTPSSFTRSVCSSYIISHTSRCCFSHVLSPLCLCSVLAGEWLLGVLPPGLIITRRTIKQLSPRDGGRKEPRAEGATAPDL